MTEPAAAERDAVHRAMLTLSRELRRWLRWLTLAGALALVCAGVFVRGLATYADGVGVEATVSFLLLLASVFTLGLPLLQVRRTRRLRRLVGSSSYHAATLTSARVRFGPLRWAAVAVDDGEETRVVTLIPGHTVRAAVSADPTGWIADHAGYLSKNESVYPVLAASGPVFHVRQLEQQSPGPRVGRRTRTALAAAGADLRMPAEP